MSAIYEREFKGILAGDPKSLETVGRTLSPRERAAYARTEYQPFLVVRAAGSLGADLVAVRHDLSFLVEVKSSKKTALYFTSAERLTEQIETIRNQCQRSGVLPLYAYRRKGVRGDAWRIFTMHGVDLSGTAGLVAGRLPPVGTTPQGNDVLRWKDGMPLSRFLEYVCDEPAVDAALAAAIPAIA